MYDHILISSKLSLHESVTLFLRDEILLTIIALFFPINLDEYKIRFSNFLLMMSIPWTLTISFILSNPAVETRQLLKISLASTEQSEVSISTKSGYTSSLTTYKNNLFRSLVIMMCVSLSSTWDLNSLKCEDDEWRSNMWIRMFIPVVLSKNSSKLCAMIEIDLLMSDVLQYLKI